MGDVIVEVEHAPVASLGDLEGALSQVSKLPRFLITTKRGEETRYLLVKPSGGADEGPALQDAGEVALPR